MSLNRSIVSSLRREFPALKQTDTKAPIIFFDGPGGTQVHGSVIEAMRDYLIQSNSNAHGAFSHSRRTDEVTFSARQALADFLNAPQPENIIFGPNMTTLNFRLSQMLGELLKTGDEVIVTRLDHDANIAPWMTLERKGVVLRHVDFDPGDCRLSMAEMERAMSHRTKFVAVNYASNAVGTINDVKHIGRLAHEAGAWVHVDAVHYAPHGPIDVQAIDCDFLVCSAYKFFGPHLGILYGRYSLLEALPAFKVRPAGDDPPDKFETGTNSFEAINGAAAAVQYIASIGDRFGSEYLDEFSTVMGRRRLIMAGMNAVRDYEKGLCRKLIAGLLKIPGLRIYGITNPMELNHRVPTISFTVEGRSPREIAHRLDEHRIFVWDGNFYAVAVTERLGLEHKGGMVRVGLCHYNTEEEVDIFLDALTNITRG